MHREKLDNKIYLKVFRGFSVFFLNIIYFCIIKVCKNILYHCICLRVDKLCIKKHRLYRNRIIFCSRCPFIYLITILDIPIFTCVCLKSFVYEIYSIYSLCFLSHIQFRSYVFCLREIVSRLIKINKQMSPTFITDLAYYRCWQWMERKVCCLLFRLRLLPAARSSIASCDDVFLCCLWPDGICGSVLALAEPKTERMLMHLYGGSRLMLNCAEIFF